MISIAGTAYTLLFGPNGGAGYYHPGVFDTVTIPGAGTFTDVPGTFEAAQDLRNCAVVNGPGGLRYDGAHPMHVTCTGMVIQDNAVGTVSVALGLQVNGSPVASSRMSGVSQANLVRPLTCGASLLLNTGDIVSMEIANLDSSVNLRIESAKLILS